MKIDKKIEMGRLLETYGDLLTDNQRDIASMYYDMDMSLKEISEQHGDISRQAVRDTIVRVDKILLDYEAKLGLVAKSDVVEDAFARVMSLDMSDELKQEMARLKSLI